MRIFALCAAAFALFTLSGCGFEAVHAKRGGAKVTGENDSINTALQSVQVVTDRSRLGQLLKAELGDQLNPSHAKETKRYQLRIRLTETKGGSFINPDGTSSRNDVRFSSSYQLTPITGGEVIDQGSINRVSSYSLSDQADYATYVAEQDARKRGIIELARAYKLRLINALKTAGDARKKVAEPEPSNARPLFR